MDRHIMALKQASKLLLLTAGFPCADAGAIWTMLYEPEMCYILDGFLALFGLVMTALFIKEKYFEKPKAAAEDSIYSDLKGQDTAGYAPLVRKGDPEAGKKPRPADNETYTALKPREGEYRELPVKKERRRKTEQVYQGLSLGNKETYDSLQMKPVSPPR